MGHQQKACADEHRQLMKANREVQAHEYLQRQAMVEAARTARARSPGRRNLNLRANMTVQEKVAALNKKQGASTAGLTPEEKRNRQRRAAEERKRQERYLADVKEETMRLRQDVIAQAVSGPSNPAAILDPNRGHTLYNQAVDWNARRAQMESEGKLSPREAASEFPPAPSMNAKSAKIMRSKSRDRISEQKPAWMSEQVLSEAKQHRAAQNQGRTSRGRSRPSSAVQSPTRRQQSANSQHDARAAEEALRSLHQLYS